MERRKLEELNLLDDFLFQELVTRGEEGEQFCRTLLGTILGKEIGRVKVIPQKTILGKGTENHGIKIDAYIEVETSKPHQKNKKKVALQSNVIQNVELQTDIYDIEPNKYRINNEAKRTRYYHSLIDAKTLRSGADYDKLKNVVIIMILPYDPFGKNRMVYTFENHCREDNTIDYEDGIKTIYLYTKGTEGNPGADLQSMLKYIETTTLDNADSEALKKIHKFVEEIRHDEEVGVSYMKACEMEKMYLEEGIKQGRLEGEDSFAALTEKLLRASRTEDLLKATNDHEYRKILYQEFGIHI